MRTRTLAAIARRYASALDEFAALAEANAPREQLDRRLRVVHEIAQTWNVLLEASTLRGAHLAGRSANAGGPVSNRVYVFVRDGAMYECICDSKAALQTASGTRDATSDRFWTIRLNGCEADGPECTGKEFTSADRTEEFENQAVAAVKACQKPCAVRQG